MADIVSNIPGSPARPPHSLLAGRRRTGRIMVAPSFLLLFLMTIYPMIYMVVIGFFTWSIIPTLPRTFVGLRQYVSIFADPSLRGSIGRTLMFVGAAVFCEIVLGFLLALLISSTRVKWIRVLFLFPSIVAPVVVGLMWRFLLGYDLGTINYFLSAVGLARVNWLGVPLNAFISIVLIDIWQWTPFAFLIFLAGLETLPIEPYEAARVDGASWFKTLRYVTMPQLVPVLSVVLMFRILDAFKLFDIVYMVTRGGPGNATYVLSYEIWLSAFFYNKLGQAAALSVVMLVIATLLTTLLGRWLARAVHSK
jgi:multiple sugar transport system permease protein